MATRKQSRIGRIFSDGRRIDKALRSAAREAVLSHRRQNLPVVIWRNGKTVLVSARELTKPSPGARN